MTKPTAQRLDTGERTTTAMVEVMLKAVNFERDSRLKSDRRDSYSSTTHVYSADKTPVFLGTVLN